MEVNYSKSASHIVVHAPCSDVCTNWQLMDGISLWLPPIDEKMSSRSDPSAGPQTCQKALPRLSAVGV